MLHFHVGEAGVGELVVPVVRVRRAAGRRGVCSAATAKEPAGCAITRIPSDFLGCALPLRSSVAHLIGSPLPREGVLPWYSKVQIFFGDTGKTVPTQLIDLGPEGDLNRGIDFLPTVVEALGLSKVDGLYHNISYRIIGGANHL